MNAKNKISRKSFFKTLLWILVIPIGAFWNAIVQRETKRKKGKREIRIPNDLSQGVTFFDSMIIVKKGTDLQIFSSKCTHLGCVIRRQEEDGLVCSCHGSHFNLDGDVVTGPAKRPLEILPHRIDNKAGEIIVSIG